MRKERPVLALIVAAMVAPYAWMFAALAPEIERPSEVRLLLIFPFVAVALGMCGAFIFWSVSVLCLEGTIRRLVENRWIVGLILGLVAAYAHVGIGWALALLDQSSGLVAAVLGNWMVQPGGEPFPWLLAGPPIAAGTLSGLTYAKLRG